MADDACSCAPGRQLPSAVPVVRPATQAVWASLFAVPLAIGLCVEGWIGFIGLDFVTTVQHSLAWAMGYVAFGAVGPVVVLSATFWRPRRHVGIAERVIRGERAGYVVVGVIALMIVAFYVFLFRPI